MDSANARESLSPLLSQITAEFLVAEIEIGLMLINLSFHSSGSEADTEYLEAAHLAYNSALELMSQSVLEGRDRAWVEEKLTVLNERLSRASIAEAVPSKPAAMAAGQ